ncbi:hypothetical protein GCM10025877_10850 [Agromyces mangrovi Wang et al. 2018]|nr:hypothetical protein GCM10025877_10850 [Agromyces mangrovi]
MRRPHAPGSTADECDLSTDACHDYLPGFGSQGSVDPWLAGVGIAKGVDLVVAIYTTPVD